MLAYTNRQHCLPSAPCDGVTEPCENGKKYADSTDCFSYFDCINGYLTRRQCPFGFGFDIELEECVRLDSSFNCKYRCITTVAATNTDVTDLGRTSPGLEAPETTSYQGSATSQTILPDGTTELTSRIKPDTTSFLISRETSITPPSTAEDKTEAATTFGRRMTSEYRTTTEYWNTETETTAPRATAKRATEITETTVEPPST